MRRFAFDFRFVINSAQTISVLPAFDYRTPQNVFLRLLDSRLPDVVGIAETDNLRRQSFIRITAFLLFAPMKSGVSRLVIFFDFRIAQSVINFLRRVFVQRPRQPDESFIIFLAFAQTFQNIVRFNFQNSGNFFSGFFDIINLQRIGIERFQINAHRQCSFRAVVNRPAKLTTFHLIAPLI